MACPSEIYSRMNLLAGGLPRQARTKSNFGYDFVTLQNASLPVGLAIALLLSLASSQNARAASAVTLAWNALTNANISGYRLYSGTQSNFYSASIDVGNTTSATLTNLTDGVTYYFVLTAYFPNGLESDFSPMISYPQEKTKPPEVTLTAPMNGALFTEPADIGLTAIVSSNGHRILSVRFYEGTTLLGESASAPYGLRWSNVLVGSYALRAQVVYDSGLVRASAVANISVATASPAPPAGAILRLSMRRRGQAVVTGTGPANHSYEVQATTNLTEWGILGTTTADSAGAFSFTDWQAPSYSARYYRVRDTTP